MRREDEIEGALATVSELIGLGKFVDAERLLEELEPLVDGLQAAVTVYLRQYLHAARDEPIDVHALEPALDRLLAAARWEQALCAASLIAGSRADDLGAVRRYRAIAIGAAEAGGARYLGAVQQRLLAAAELADGNEAAGLAHLERALLRLEGVLLTGARLEQARCYELGGDVHAAAGRLAAAGECYDQALERIGHGDLAAHRERLENKRRGLG